MSEGTESYAAGPDQKPLAAPRLKVFLSYSRSDVAFADQLLVALEDRGFDPVIDRHDIDPGEAWKARLGALILSADAVAFVLTEKSAGSPICAWEVDEAKRLGKRIVPVVPADVKAAAPPALADLNWIHFYATPAIPESGMFDGLRKLERALKVDLVWLREQTRLSQRAVEWQSARGEDRLLRGDELQVAEAWLGRSPKDANVPVLVRDFIAASADGQLQREAAAKSQLEEREAALKVAEQAARERADEQAKRKKADARLRWVSFAALGGAAVLVSLALALLWWAGLNKAEANDKLAEQYAQASYEALRNNDPATAAMIALAGDQALKGGILEGFFRPSGYESLRLALVRARAEDRLVQRVRANWDTSQANMGVDGIGERYIALAAMPDGKRVLAIKQSGSLTISDRDDPIYSTGYDAEVWAPGAAKPDLTQSIGEVSYLQVLPDGDSVLLRLITEDEAAIVLWSLSKGEVVRTFAGAVPPLAVSDDGQLALTGSEQCNGAMLWPLGAPAIKPVLRGSSKGCVSALAFEGGAHRHVIAQNTKDDHSDVSIWKDMGGAADKPAFATQLPHRSEDATWLGSDVVLTQKRAPAVRIHPDWPAKAVEEIDLNSSVLAEGSDTVYEVRGSPGEVMLLANLPEESLQLVRTDPYKIIPLFDQSRIGDGVFLPAAGTVATTDHDGLAFWRADAAMRHDQRYESGVDMFPWTFLGDEAVLRRGRDFSANRIGEQSRPLLTAVPPGATLLSPDGKLIAEEHLDQPFSYTEAGEEKLYPRPPMLAVYRGSEPLIQQTGNWNAAGAAFSADSTHIGFRYDDTVSLWRIGDKTPSVTFAADQGADNHSLSGIIALSPDGTRIAIAFNGYVELWQVENGKARRLCDDARRRCFTISGKVDTIAFNHAGDRFAVANDVGAIVLFGLDGAREQTFAAEYSPNEIMFSADDKKMLTTGRMRAALWDIRDRRPIQSFDIPGDRLGKATLGSDGRSVLTGSDRSLARLEISPAVFADHDALVKGACEQAAMRGFDGFSPAQVEAYGLLTAGDNPCAGSKPGGRGAPPAAPPQPKPQPKPQAKP